VRVGVVKEEELPGLLANRNRLPSIILAQFEIVPTIVKLVPAQPAQKYQISALGRAGATLTIAMTDPTNVFAMDDIKLMTGYNVQPVVASELGIKAANDNYYGSASSLEMKKVLEDLQHAEPGDLEVHAEDDELEMDGPAE